MEKRKNGELVINIYDEKGVTISEKILEIFEKYLMSSLQNGEWYTICTVDGYFDFYYDWFGD